MRHLTQDELRQLVRSSLKEASPFGRLPEPESERGSSYIDSTEGAADKVAVAADNMMVMMTELHTALDRLSNTLGEDLREDGYNGPQLANLVSTVLSFERNMKQAVEKLRDDGWTA